ncbi:MAG TPA: glycosyltransferase family 2 protein [Gemmatimonadales bacterium]|jgi:glycosyltransferase involved in cell wall biosynthesis
MTGPIRVSLLVPAKDEAENLPEFLRQCAEALPALGVGFEVVVTDDGSRDDSPAVLRRLQGEYPFLRVATHLRQRGIADALRSAADLATGDVFVFYPADLQYRPEDIPRLVAPILADTADIVTGTKQGKYEKAFVSTVYNTLCRWLFGVRVTDLNSVKAFRREVLEIQPLRPDFHRYMVVIAAAEGFRLTSTPVPLYPRTAGVSKFTWRRIPIGVLDLLSVWFQLRFGRKPMIFFGFAGAMLFLIGMIAGIAALVLRFGYLLGFPSLDTGFRPLLNLVEMMVISGFVLIGFGFIGEMLAGIREDQRELLRRLHAMRRD